jgi:hypothetical protein
MMTFKGSLIIAGPIHGILHNSLRGTDEFCEKQCNYVNMFVIAILTRYLEIRTGYETVFILSNCNSILFYSFLLDCIIRVCSLEVINSGLRIYHF